jgi:fumarate hydratase subunit beta
MAIKTITPPLDEQTILELKVGDEVRIAGKIFGGRDTAHKRFVQLLSEGKPLPIELKGAIIYYVGPTPARPGYVIGSAGPTTSTRMDRYVEAVLKAGLKGMIGKGERKPEVGELLKKYKAVYLAAIGGAGAYLSKRIKSSRIVAFEELGPEAVYEFEVEDFPVIVAMDAHGGNIYKEALK